MKGRISMKFMQYILFYAFKTNISKVLTNHLIVIIYAIFNLWELWGSLQNWTIFWWRHNRSRWRHNILKFAGLLDFGLIFSKNSRRWNSTFQLLAELRYRHPTFLIQSSKKAPIQKKIHKPDLFSTESIMLNPIVQSDLVTYRGVTILILFLQATNSNCCPDVVYEILVCFFIYLLSNRLFFKTSCL